MRRTSIPAGVGRIIIAFLTVVGVSVIPALAVAAQSYTFTLLAGSAGGPGMRDGVGTAARFYYPQGVAVDGAGNVYVADTGNRVIRRIDSTGKVTSYAGDGYWGSDDGGAGSASFASPVGLAPAPDGSLYVIDQDSVIRRVWPSGIVTTVAGRRGYHGDTDGNGLEARFRYPAAGVFDAGGNFYVVDSGNHTIRKITPAGIVSTLAGTAGVEGSADGTGAAAAFSSPAAIAFAAGSLYVTDSGNHTIRKVTLAGAVTTLAGTPGVPGTGDGLAGDARFVDPRGIVRSADGQLYVTDADASTIRHITLPGGSVTTVAGSPYADGSADGAGATARFAYPMALALDSAGNVYVVDHSNHAIRRMTSALNVTTFAGLAGGGSFGLVNGDGADARFSYPSGMAWRGGTLYVADASNHAIRAVDTAGNVSTLAGGQAGLLDAMGTNARFSNPSGVAVGPTGDLYVADRGNNVIRKITPLGSVSTFAGALMAGSNDGSRSAARFSAPRAVAVDPSGTVYVADSGNHTIRKISGDTVTTLAGSADVTGSEDGTGDAAHFYYPIALALGPDGNLYVCDHYNRTIRRVTPLGEVTTLAGSPGASGVTDGTGAAARFRYPSAIAADAAGNLFVADGTRIRKVTALGVVTTVGGESYVEGSQEGTGTHARFSWAQGIAVDTTGTLYVADTDNHAVKRGQPALADSAVIDSSTGATGVPRQLFASPPTATTYAWSIIRQPTRSSALMSAPASSVPTFTPDRNDVYVFELVATSPSGSSITSASLSAYCASNPPTPTVTSSLNPSCGGQTVTLDAGAGYDFYLWSNGMSGRQIVVTLSETTSLEVVGYLGTCPSDAGSFTQTVIPVAAPPALTATRASSSSVALTWGERAQAAGYEVWRGTTAANLALVATVQGTAHTDSVPSNGTYLYRVRAVYSCGFSSWSGIAYVTTASFTDDPLVAGQTVVKAIHLTELRAAINRLRAAGGVGPYSFSDADPSSLPIRVTHIAEMRTAIAGGRAALGFGPPSYTNFVAKGSLVRAVDLQELRAFAGSSATSVQLLANPGFESGNVGWNATDGIIGDSPLRPARSGSWRVWMNGTGAEDTDFLSQTVSLPASATDATLSFWLRIDTDEDPNETYPYDSVTFSVRNTDGGVLAELGTFSNLNGGAEYVLHTFDLTAFAGQTIEIYVEAYEDGIYQTSFVLDDFALDVN